MTNPANTIYTRSTLNDAICDGTLPALNTVRDVVDFLSDVVADHIMVTLVGRDGINPSPEQFAAAHAEMFPRAFALLLDRLDRFMPDTAARIRAGIAAGALDA